MVPLVLGPFKMTPLILGTSAISLIRLAVKELKLSYYVGENIPITIYTHYGNLT